MKLDMRKKQEKKETTKSTKKLPMTAKIINKNDIILMCSDGLTNMVSEEEIYQITKENPKEAANKLTMLANNHGGYDNITVLIIM